MVAKLTDLIALLRHQLQLPEAAERLLAEAMPAMAAKACNLSLREAIDMRHRITKHHLKKNIK